MIVKYLLGFLDWSTFKRCRPTFELIVLDSVVQKRKQKPVSNKLKMDNNFSFAIEVCVFCLCFRDFMNWKGWPWRINKFFLSIREEELLPFAWFYWSAINVAVLALWNILEARAKRSNAIATNVITHHAVVGTRMVFVFKELSKTVASFRLGWKFSVNAQFSGGK